MSNQKFVISLGGSAVVPDEIDVNFLKRFCFLIRKQVVKGSKFVLIVGGGSTARKYQQAVEQVVKTSQEQKDWIGIYATRLNARLVASVLIGQKCKALFNEKLQLNSFGKYSVIVGGGDVPGHSSDFMAVKFAVDLGIKTVVNIGKPRYVYSANPDKDPTAKPIERLTWNEYFKIIPAKWIPGMNAPFDPIASRLAKKHNIKVIVTGAGNLKNISNILAGKKFLGTTII